MSLEAAASSTCAEAERTLRKAQEKLSVATRQADAKGASYYTCMKRHRNKGGVCRAQRRALDQATVAKQRALAAYRFARAHRDTTCRG